jgi:tetratricopeptide (TPR) repeat protein
MYDRYKSKRRNTGPYKLLAALIILGAAIFLVVRYHEYLAFWKYNRNKLYGTVEVARHIKDPLKKREALTDLAETFERYKEEHPVSADAFFVSGEVHYLLGATYLPGNFSEMYINDRMQEIAPEARSAFLMAIKDLMKGAALENGMLDDSYVYMIAKAGLYAGYYSPEDIFGMIEKTGESVKAKDVENIRFYSIINIMNRREDYGLKFLTDYGRGKDSIQGLLLLATAQRAAKKYTGAIMTYKDVLAKTSDTGIQKLVYINLGKIYFNQSLYRESLDQFTLALQIDQKDTATKIWMGKNYLAMGAKDKAKAIWSEVLTTDGSNIEARQLLGAI